MLSDVLEIITATGAPGVTTDKLYNVSGTLYWNGTDLTAGGGGVANPMTADLDVGAYSVVGSPPASPTADGGDIVIQSGIGGATSGEGGRITIQPGQGYGTGEGGDLRMYGGYSNGTAEGGDIRLWAGSSAGTSGGDTDIRSGSTSNFSYSKISLLSNNAFIDTGAATSGNGGHMKFETAGGTSGGDGGYIRLNAGAGNGAGAGGAINLDAGTASGAGGIVKLTGGNSSSSGTGGNVTLQPGNSTSGTVGDIVLEPPGGGSDVSVRVGTGVPSHSANNGSLFCRTDGTGPNLYVRENGAWVSK